MQFKKSLIPKNKATHSAAAQNNSGKNSNTYLEDNRPEVVAQRKILKTAASNTTKGVVQALGWETLGSLNPRRYLPVSMFGYTPEQMAENGLAGGPAAAQAPPAAQDAQAAVPPLVEDERDDGGPGPSTVAAKKKRRNRNRKAKGKAPMAAPPAAAAAAPAPYRAHGGEASDSDSDDWETIDRAGDKREKRQRGAANRAAKQQFVAGLKRRAKNWMDKPNQDGTMNMHGTGSAAEHDLEARAKVALREANPEGAIRLLREAIDGRRAQLGSKGSPGYQGHLDAIAYLQRIIDSILASM